MRWSTIVYRIHWKQLYRYKYLYTRYKNDGNWPIQFIRNLIILWIYLRIYHTTMCMYIELNIRRPIDFIRWQITVIPPVYWRLQHFAMYSVHVIYPNCSPNVKRFRIQCKLHWTTQPIHGVLKLNESKCLYKIYINRNHTLIYVVVEI